MQTHTPIQLESSPVLAWEALSHPSVERTKRWYITAGSIAAIVSIYGLFTGSWSTAVVCLVAAALYYLIHDHKPLSIRIELYESGVRFDGDFFRWDELVGFWFLRTPTYIELRLVAKKPHKRMVIQLGDLDPERLGMILGQRLPELKGKREGLLDTFIRICKL